MRAIAPTRSVIAQLVLLTVICLALFSNTFSNDLVWDDPALIHDNPYIRDVRNIPLFFLPGYWNKLHPDPGQYRPVRTASFALDYHFWGLNPAGYHISNVMIHAFNVVLIFWLVTMIGKQRTPSAAGMIGHDGLPGLAFLTAVFFAAHPIHTESINLVKNRSDLLAFMFMLVSFMLFLKHLAAAGRISRVLSMILSWCFFMAALTSKEMALSLPGLMALHAVCFTSGTQLKKTLLRLVPYAVIIVLFVGFKQLCLDSSFFRPAEKTIAGTFLPVDFGQHALVVIKTMGLYLSLLAVPYPLNAEHVFAIPVSLLERPVLLSLILLLLLGIVALRAYRRDRIVLFAVGWMVLTLVPAANIVYLATRPIAEQRLYIPSFGLCLLLAYGLALLATVLSGRLKFIRGRTISGLLAGGIILFYALITVTRNFDWRNEVIFYSKTLISNPGSVRMHYNLGTALNRAGYYTAAIHHYQQALIFHPDYSEGHNNLGVAYYQTGNYVKAVAHFQAALRLKPDSVPLRVNLGLALYKAGWYQAAERYLQSALRLNPLNVKAYVVLGEIRAATGRANEAVFFYKKALAVAPDNIDANYNLGLVLMAGREYAEAFKSFSRVLAIDPDHERAKEKQALCRVMAGPDTAPRNRLEKP